MNKLEQILSDIRSELNQIEEKTGADKKEEVIKTLFKIEDELDTLLEWINE